MAFDRTPVHPKGWLVIAILEAMDNEVKHLPGNRASFIRGVSLTSTPRRRKTRDLTKAVTLRPADVFALYGIPSSTLCELCKHPDPDRRIPSSLIPGRCGRKGLRLINHDELRAWLARWRTTPPADQEGESKAA